ncbi:MAG TPA: bifunctional phosphoribosyl-AMP cyclohydrolase/phosphoribosyl-ATP diphosphatase, partial [Synergistaceae bacterium]|nr:bifunctional phosphoribosyl-AMP cyclohydrolase/phosphoribosyl-ATP diphosphatase [Synergistaceae bacterium]
MGFDTGSIRFDDEGLVPVILQDISTGEVLTLAWANRQAL